MSETTTEQLAEIEGQATEYTPPEGWRVLAVGEALREGDVTVRKDGYCYPTERVGSVVGANQRYIRPIEPQPEPVQVREGQWRTRHGDIRNVTPTPAHDSRAKRWPWRDAKYDQTWREDGGYHIIGESPSDLVEYLGPIEPDKTQELETKTQELPEYTPPEGWRVLAVGEILQAGDMWVWPTDDQLRQTVHVGAVVGAKQRYIRPIEPQPQSESQPEPVPDTELQAQVAFLKGREVTLGTRLQQEREVTTRLRGDLELMQKLLGTERRKVAQLEDLVGSLRTINVTQEKAFTAAGKENTALRNQLAAVASVAADRQRLLIELDAAQQVPADSPELRQLRADLEQVTRERDQHLDSYQRIFGDLETIRETTKAAAVEAIAEWLQPIRAVDNEHLANETLQHLPQIMRHLTGLAQD